jgi:hypothetical protein
MIQHSLRLASGLVALALLAGCTTADPDLGLSVQANALAQIIDVNPVYAGIPIEGGSGERQVDAIKRYNKGAVKPLDTNTISRK